MIDNVEFIDNQEEGHPSNHYLISRLTNFHDEACFGWFKTLKGNHSITNCDFYSGYTGVSISDLVDSKVIVGGGPQDGNVFYTTFVSV